MSHWGQVQDAPVSRRQKTNMDPHRLQWITEERPRINRYRPGTKQGFHLSQQMFWDQSMSHDFREEKCPTARPLHSQYPLWFYLNYSNYCTANITPLKHQTNKELFSHQFKRSAYIKTPSTTNLNQFYSRTKPELR